MTDEQFLVRAVYVNPADDAPRLQLADCLQERGQEERSEFIRVQCELARVRECPNRQCSKGNPSIGCTYHMGLRRRERELFRDSGPKWWNDLPGNWRCTVTKPVGCEIETAEGWVYVVRRGFVDEVRLPTAAFLGGPCGQCGRENAQTRAENDNWQGRCQACDGSGRVGGIAAKLFAAHPITGVRLTDKSPWQEGDSGFIWFPERDARPFQHPQSDIPDEIFDRMDAFRAYNPLLIKRYSTQEFAEAALSRACAAIGRDAAKIST